jgi:acyl-CoA synthetase (NDP forming)
VGTSPPNPDLIETRVVKERGSKTLNTSASTPEIQSIFVLRSPQAAADSL